MSEPNNSYIELSDDEHSISIFFSGDPPKANTIRVIMPDSSTILTDTTVLSQVMGIPDLFEKILKAARQEQK